MTSPRTLRALLFPLLGVLALCALLSVVPLARASGYDTSYDYPGRGDDWYGRDAIPDLSRDFPPPIVEAYSDGDDYGRGYVPQLAFAGQDVPLVRTRESLFEYVFFHGGSSRCFDAAECDDGWGCNGIETCDGISCQPGTPLNCSDGDPCTYDSCIDGCAHEPVPPPETVTLLQVAKVPGSELVAELSWASSAGADYYNVYRGEDTSLTDLVCFEAAVTGLSTQDDGALPWGQLFVHLVSAEDACSESSLGADSSGAPRPNDLPCP